MVVEIQPKCHPSCGRLLSWQTACRSQKCWGGTGAVKTPLVIRRKCSRETIWLFSKQCKKRPQNSECIMLMSVCLDRTRLTVADGCQKTEEVCSEGVTSASHISRLSQWRLSQTCRLLSSGDPPQLARPLGR